LPDQDELKLAAAEAAMAFLPSEGIIGLGTGSTARHAIRLIAERIARQEVKLLAVATSTDSAQAAVEAGIPLLGDDGPWEVGVTFDGADEASPSLDLVKGGGGALLREKIVNSATSRRIFMVDGSKLSSALGFRCRVPVEVSRFGWAETQREIEQRAGPASRREREGAPFLTDNGNYILDVATGPIEDPAALERELESLPGVVVSGLFVARADVLVIAGPGGVETRFASCLDEKKKNGAT
jgi:ribose 5-phosphate isomerase A